MDRDVQNNGLIIKFVTMFDTQDHSIDLDGEKHLITTQHVADILGIEDGEDEEEIRMPRKGHRIKAKPKVRRAFIGKKGICMDKVKQILRESLDIDDVKRAYMLLALRYIVHTPASHEYLAASFIDLVADVNALNKRRWATSVITSLVDGIEAYKNSYGETERPIGGCPLLLQLYATKGSITTPLERDKRRKKARDKDFETIESGNLKAMDTTREIYEKVMAKVRQCERTIKVHKSQRDVMKGVIQNILSILETQRDATLAKIQNEHVAAVVRDTRYMH